MLFRPLVPEVHGYKGRHGVEPWSIYLHACIHTYLCTYIPTYVHAYIHTYTILSGRRFFSFMTGDGHGNEDGDNPTHMLPRVTCSARQRFAGLNTNADRSVDADVDFVTIQNLLASIARICQTGGTGFAPTCLVTVRKHPLHLESCVRLWYSFTCVSASSWS